MRRNSSKCVMVMLAALLAVSGCASNSANTGTAAGTDSSTAGSPKTTEATEAAPNAGADSSAIKDLVLPKLITNELETFNYLQSQSGADTECLLNLVDGLVEEDNYGVMKPCIAESWETKDEGLNWTFHIRKGVNWVDSKGEIKAECNAIDFATGLEFILNYHKNNSANTAMPMELIQGAEEYYEYTKALSKEEAQALKMDTFYEMVGVSVPDDYTITYTCTGKRPYFYTVARSFCLFPAATGLLEELGPDAYKAVNNETMWYNGCYIMESYIQNNEKVFVKNPNYWDKDSVRFDTMTFKMVESNDVAFQLYQSGELDYVELTESNLKTIADNPNSPYYDQIVEKRPTAYSYQIHFNYDKRDKDGNKDTNWNTAAANLAFRKALYYGLDLTSYYKRTNAINPLKCENNFFTMKNFVYTSDGRDYIELVREKLGLGQFNGETMVRLNKEKADAYKKQAMEELTAKGVTFPVEADYFVSAGSQTDLDSAAVLKQVFADSLGEDFINLNIKTYVTSFAKEARDQQLQAITINGWGSDYDDPQNGLAQICYGEDNAIYATKFANINQVQGEDKLVNAYKEYTDMINRANEITDDMDKRYQAFAEAEAYLIDNVLLLPCNYKITWALTHINEYSYKNVKLKNVETSTKPYTTKQYEEFEKAYNSGSSQYVQ